MHRPARALCALILALAALPTTLLPTRAQEASPVPAMTSSNVTVFATGLDNPRGLTFGLDGLLYVAEGGTGGTISTEGQCDQVVPPVGPYTGGDTARISTIDAAGERTTLIDGLPSNQTSPELGNLVSGVADVAFLDDTLYYLMAAAGCSHGHPDVPNGVFRIEPDGTATLAADLSAFVQANPVAVPNPGDFEPDEGAYAMAELDGQLYVAESNHGALDRVSPDGTVERVIDFSATEGHIVPTAIAVGPDGDLYVGNLTPLPYPNGGAVIYQVTPDGDLSLFAEGLTTVLGAAFDDQGQLYVLETSTDNPEAPPFFHADSGRVVRLTEDGGWDVVATGLSFPTAMTFGPDGLLYVSNFGFGYPPGAGQIVTVDVTAPVGAAAMATPMASAGGEMAAGLAPVPDTALGPAIPEAGYLVEEIRDGLYWVTDGLYQAMFLTTGEGVILVDAPPSLGPNLAAAIAAVTDEPVTHLVYSHHHADHIGAAGQFADAEIIAHEATADLLARGNDPNRPLPTVTFADSYTLSVGDQTLRLDYHGSNHEPGNIFIYAPQQKVLMAVDLVFPGWVPFADLALAEDVPGFVAAHDQMLAYDFDTFLGGHLTRLGTREDVETAQAFVRDVQANAAEALATVDFMGIAQEVGFNNPWALFDAYLGAVAHACAEATIPAWQDRLGGADVFTEGHCWVMIESLRVD